MADVTVTIVLYNSADHLEDCLLSLAPDLEAGLANLVAVDNASPDASAALVSRVAPDAQVLVSEYNRGFAGGCNLAWSRVDTPYWLLLNPDTQLEPGALAELVAFMESRPELGAASPWLRDPTRSGRLYPGRPLPSLWRTLVELLRLHRLLPGGLRARVLLGPYVTDRAAAAAPDPGWIPGTALIVRASAVAEAGPLDESFFLYGEDLEWCWRMRDAGWGIGVSDRATVLHHERTSSDRTWSSEVVDDRIAEGILRACALRRGRLRAGSVGLATALALALEALDPRRSRDQRQLAARTSRAWGRAVRNGRRARVDSRAGYARR